MIGSAGNDFFANTTGQVLGNDVYTGNGGADIYDYTYAADSMNGDTITDFDIDDVIDLRFNNLEPAAARYCQSFHWRCRIQRDSRRISLPDQRHARPSSRSTATATRSSIRP